MNILNPNYSLVLVLLSFFIFFNGCKQDTLSSDEKRKILSIVIDHQYKDKRAIFHKTMSADTVRSYLKPDMSLDDLGFVLGKNDSLGTLFTSDTFERLYQEVLGYHQMSIDSLYDNRLNQQIVAEIEIPTFVKEQSGYIGDPPFMDVLFLSTPLIFEDKAVVIKDSFSFLPEIIFLVKTDNWHIIDIGTINVKSS